MHVWKSFSAEQAYAIPNLMQPLWLWLGRGQMVSL